MGTGTLVAVAAIGAAVGFLGGMFGKGGSAIATPLLSLVGLPAIVAVASPLPSTIPAALVAAYAYWRVDLVDREVVRWSVLVGVPATIAGAYASRYTGGGPLVLVTEFVLVGMGLRLLQRPGGPHEVGVGPLNWHARLVGVAAVVGLVSGLLANGGGFLLAPLFVLVLHLPIKRAFASSLVVAAALAVPGTVVHAALGHIDWWVVLAFGAAAIPLSAVGARVAIRTESVRLERVYGAGLLALGVITLATSL
jgi:uncharacterized membrane protein YfcA